MKRCISCGKTLETSSVNKTGHSPAPEYVTVKAPTCTSVGEKVRYCTVCSKALETVVLQKINHTASDVFEITKVPKCTTNGERVKRCTECKNIILNEVINKNGHTSSKKYTVTKKATCTANGEKVKKCTVCGDVAEKVQTEKLGHSYSDSYTVDKKSTLTDSGSKSRHCKRCDSKTDNETIPKIMSVMLSKDAFTYNGKAKTLSVTVKNSKGNKLKKDRDYKVSYKKHKNIGSYKVTVKFKGKYEGEMVLTYKILPRDIASLKVENITESSAVLSWKKQSGKVKYRIYRLNRKTGKYKLIKETSKNKVTLNKLLSGTEYTFSVKAVKKVNGKLYKSEKPSRVSVSTVPGKVSLIACSDKSRSIRLIWDKTSCDGYEIYKYNTSSGKYEHYKTIKKSGITTYERNNMRRGESCYFKIRSYKNNGTEILYSSFSDPVVVTVKY